MHGLNSATGLMCPEVWIYMMASSSTRAFVGYYHFSELTEITTLFVLVVFFILSEDALIALSLIITRNSQTVTCLT